MAMDDTESCSSRAVDSSPAKSRQHRQKLEVFNEVLRRIQQSDYEEAKLPDFDDHLWLHFNRLPPRYALDVNVERAEDVLTHQRLLHLAEDPANRPVFEVRLVQVPSASYEDSADSAFSNSPMIEDPQSYSNFSSRQGIHPPPMFGSSPNFEAFALQANRFRVEDGNSTVNSTSALARTMHEITFSTADKPKLLSQLTSILAEVGLNIQEAHAFSTIDGFSLDVFVVDGWPYEATEQLRIAMEKEILKIKLKSVLMAVKALGTVNTYIDQVVSLPCIASSCYISCDAYKRKMQEESWLKQHSTSAVANPNCTRTESFNDYVKIPTDGTDVWEIDANLLTLENKVASGSYGDLFKGTYRSQEVAIKILKPESVNTDMLREFSQEVYIMRKIRHRNVVQFIGACTRPPNLCIVTEFMSRGSIYDFLHKQRGAFKLPSLLKVAIDIAKGMNYLHENNIIHRDLKTANLLMDENEVVKVGDFGVARVQTQSGVMTAETGTYRWMAPEVIEHRPYNHKADVFSFGIVLWELLTGELPYSFLTPLQAAVGVVQKDLRPTIPKHTHPKLAGLLERCWLQDPTLRPDFSTILEILQQLTKEVGSDGDGRPKDKVSGRFLSALRRGHH